MKYRSILNYKSAESNVLKRRESGKIDLKKIRVSHIAFFPVGRK